MTPPRRTLTFHCRGHRNVKATHGKTLEWTREPEISPRATCVVGVAADFDAVAAARLRGPLRIAMGVAGTALREEVHAYATPLAAVRDSLVVRCSDEQGGRTFAFGADRGAAALDRAFARALADPAAVLAVTVEELAPSPTESARCGALVLASPLAEPEPPEGTTAVPEGTGAPLRGEAAARLAAVDGVVTVTEVRGEKGAAEALLQRLTAGERLALVGDPLDPTVGQIAGRALAAGVTVSPVWGVAPWQAVAAACGSSRPIHLKPEPLRKAAALTRALEEAHHRPALTVLAVELPPGTTVAALEEVLGQRPVTVGRELLTRRERLLRGTPEALRASLGLAPEPRRGERAESWVLALCPEDWPGEAGGLGPLTPVFEELLRRGVAVRTLADAAARAPGVARREAYQALLRLSEQLNKTEDTG